MKSEPDEYSIEDLAQAPKLQSCWSGIRNYQARNFIRDSLRDGDMVLFYHSSCKVPAIVGTAVVVGTPYADPTAFEPTSAYYDPKSTAENPRWLAIDIAFRSKYRSPITLQFIKQHPPLSQMYLVTKGSRLSIQPVTANEWKLIEELGGQHEEI